MENMTGLLSNPIFLSALFSWFLAQLLKALIELIRNRPLKARDILITFVWTTGGMPSSHSALVTAICVAVGLEVGINSTIFIVTFFYGMLTIRDALGVRRAAGSQAKAINEMTNVVNSKLDSNLKNVKEIHGHTSGEVTAGIFVGLVIAVLFTVLL
ncbi:MAG: divergent PAP2 family protein [Spirochaetia bacterium]